MSNSFSGVVRLGKDAELKTVGKGAVCEFSAASTTGFGERKGTLWLRCALWGKQGEAICKHLVKGKQLWLAGELSQREYERKDGTKGTSLELLVRDLEFVGGRGEQEHGESAPPPPPPGKREPLVQPMPQDDSPMPF